MYQSIFLIILIALYLVVLFPNIFSDAEIMREKQEKKAAAAAAAAGNSSGGATGGAKK